MATSQNGWPALASSSPRLHTWVIPARNGTFRLRLRNGSAGFLLAHFALFFSEVIEDATRPKGSTYTGVDDWGYAYRPVRNSTDVSNHASGTAMDINATVHPMGKVRTGAFRFLSKRTAVHRRLRWMRGTIRWGGDYSGRKDEMHFEIVQNLSSCEREARRLTRSWRGRRILAANPGQKKVIFS